MSFYHCKDILRRSDVATAAYYGGHHMGLFYQHNDGSIHLGIREDPEGSWTGGDALTLVPAGKAMPHTPMASTYYRVGVSDDYQFRLYYLSPDFTLREVCFGSLDQSGWYDGDLNSQNIKIPPHSRLSAISWTDGTPFINVYYQGHDDKIHELRYYDSKWSGDLALPGNPLRGTGLAFVQRGDSIPVSIRGYFQNATTLTLEEICWEGKWVEGAHLGQGGPMPYRTTIAACAPDSPRSKWISVYHLDVNDRLVEMYWQAGWHGPSTLSANRVSFTPNVPASNISAICFWRQDGYNVAPDRSIFVQEPHNIWSERRCVRGTWQVATMGLKHMQISMLPPISVNPTHEPANPPTPG